MNKNLKHWLYALTSKYISGGASSVTAGFTASFIAPNEFNLGSQFYHFIELVIITFIVNGILNAMNYLKDNPLPPDNDDNSGPYTKAGGLAMVLCASLFLAGCTTEQIKESDESAHQVASWVAERQGFIENIVMAVVQANVYSTDAGTVERNNVLLRWHVASGNINSLITQGKVDMQSIREAFKVNEQYFDPVADAFAPVIANEINKFQQNGFGDATIEILKAVSAGIRDGMVTR